MSGANMSVGASSATGRPNDSQQWAALDSQYERLVDPSHPLLRGRERERTEAGRAADSSE